jgi:hypothetical protein
VTVQVIGVPEHAASQAMAAITSVLTKRPENGRLHVIAYRTNGSWHVFVADADNQQLHDAGLADHLLGVLKDL